MRISVEPTRKNAVQLRVAVLVLVAVALVSPQLAWADHASNHPSRQLDDPTLFSTSEAHAASLDKYKTGELVFHASGQRDDTAFSASADSEQIDTAFLAANPEIIAFRRHIALQQGVAAAASSARWVALGEYYARDADGDATFLAANPETRAYRRFIASQEGVAAAASSARWVALGVYYTDAEGDAAFLAANPEVGTYQRFMQARCSETSQVC